MTDAQDRKPKPGDMVVLTEVPKGLLNGLPIEDHKAISEIVGKPSLLTKYDSYGRAELKFADSEGVIHFIYVNPTVIGPIE